MLLEFPHRAHPPLVSTLVPTIFNVATAFRHDRSHGIPVGPAKSRGCLRNPPEWNMNSELATRMGRILLRLKCEGLPKFRAQVAIPAHNYVDSWAHDAAWLHWALQKNTVKHIVKHVTKIYKVVSQSGGNFVGFMTGKNMKLS